MKKTLITILVVLLIIGCIGAICSSFYEATSYYNWTDEAITTKLVRIENSFTLEKSATTVTANGKLMNCTNTTLEVNEGEIIIYCQDTSTDEIYSFKNSTSYTFVSEKETTVYITIYKGAINTENSKVASKILEDYRIIKIEYQVSENEIYTLETIAQTGSKLVPLGTFIAVPIIISLFVVGLIILLQYKKEKPLSLSSLIKQLKTKNKILILFLLLIVPITFISVSAFAFIDKHWNIATFYSISIISTVIFVALIVLLFFLIIKQTRIKSLSKYLTKEINSEREKIYIIEKPFKEKLSEPLKLRRDKQLQIENIENEISNINNEISIFNNNKLLSEIRNIEQLDGWQFEKYCAKLFSKLGYQVQVTKGSGDFGADLILDNSISVQCKLYSGSVGLHALQEVYSSMAKYKTKYAWVVTNSTFTKQAIEYASDAQIKLIDRNSLKQLMIKAFNNYPDNYLQERQKIIIDLKAKIDCLNSEIAEIVKVITATTLELEQKTKSLNDNLNILNSDYDLLEFLTYKEIKKLGKNYR